MRIPLRERTNTVNRDYLKEASSVIFGNKISLGEKAKQNPEAVVGNLIFVIEDAQNPIQAMIRKAAAYGLGQLGDPRSMERLRQFYEHESAPGVRDAMLAAMTAIKCAPIPEHTEEERLDIIDAVYNNRMPADWT